MHTPTIAIVVPAFNEEAVVGDALGKLARLLSDLIDKARVAEQSFLLLVDDGSSDNTWPLVQKACTENGNVKAIKLSRNFGHQNALLAGLLHVNGKVDAAVTIDADLQQDETAIPEFIEKHKKGNEIVLGVRDSRKTDGIFKRMSASFFYAIMWLLGAKSLRNHADFRLFGKKALQALAEHSETNLYLRGLAVSLGFKTCVVPFTGKKRTAGKTKYSLRRMLAFAMDGITSFTILPLRLISMLGMLVFLFSMCMSVYVVVIFYVADAVPGWASTVLPIYFIGGIQLISLGVVGEYVGKTYMEAKRRPRYIIEQEI